MNDTPTIAVPAATLILTRPSARVKDSFEVLLLKRSQDAGFAAGSWVFPGGRIEDEDFTDTVQTISPQDQTLNGAIQTAALRETKEECGVDASEQTLHYFAHWTTPEFSAKRYSTWYFIADMPHGQPINIDQHEIIDHCWLTPQAALDKYWAGELQFTPPTFISLAELSDIEGSAHLADFIASRHAPVVLPERIDSNGGQQTLLCVDSNPLQHPRQWRQRTLVRHEKGMRVEF
ncbi:NUDIX hydrolase [Halioxenophilus aromaticivorans]